MSIKQKVPNAGFPWDTNLKQCQFRNFLLIDLKLAFSALKIDWSGKRSGLSAKSMKQKVPNAGFPRDIS